MRKTVFIWLSMILCFLFPIPINASQVKCTTLIENTEGPWNAGGMTVVKNRIYIAKKRYHASENLYCYSIKGKLLSKRKLPKKTGHVNGMTYMEGKLYICNMTNQITVVTNITNLKKAKFSFLKAPCSVYGISHTEKGKLLLLNIQRSSKKCKIRCIQAKIKNKKIIQEKELGM